MVDLQRRIVPDAVKRRRQPWKEEIDTHEGAGAARLRCRVGYIDIRSHSFNRSPERGVLIFHAELCPTKRQRLLGNNAASLAHFLKALPHGCWIEGIYDDRCVVRLQ